MCFIDCSEKFVFSRVRSTSKLVIYSSHEMEYIWYLSKIKKDFFILYENETYRKHSLTFLIVSRSVSEIKSFDSFFSVYSY